MAGRGVIGVKGASVRNILSSRKIDTPDTVQKAVPMESLIPTIKGQDVVQPSTDWGSGKITAPKGSSGVSRATTKSKKGW